MSKNEFMEELNVARIIEKYNLIIPEIQREYVWGNNDYDILDSFFEDIKENLKQAPPEKIEQLKNQLVAKINLGDFNAINDIKKEIDKIQSINIGFLYSYKPSYFIHDDLCEDVFLIDGQQRFTTIFLSLVFFSLKENRKNELIKTFRFNSKKEKIAFDYRVRNQTHNFLIDLLVNVNNLQDIFEITKSTWYLSDYSDDVTIKAMVKTFEKLEKTFKNDDEKYYDFLLQNITFWHFKTAATSQGEELYITMNSRGKVLADNETIRAKLFEDDKIKNEQIKWSEKWEVWQDFFWQHKENNRDADEGFNEFLRWVQIINMTEKQTIDVDDEDEKSIDKKEITEIIKWTSGQKLNYQHLSLDQIDKYFNAMRYLFCDFEGDIKNHINDYKKYSKFDLLDSDWLSPIRPIDQIDCFRLLPALHYCKIILEKKQKINSLNLFRLLRFFYNLRNDTTVLKTANVQCINGIKLVARLIEKSDDIKDIVALEGLSKSLLTEEEKYKLSLYRNKNRIELEDSFWQAEDHRLCKGKITHLLQMTNFDAIVEEFVYDENYKFSSSNLSEFQLTKFSSIYNSIVKFSENEEEFWGDLLHTDVYLVKDNNRLIFINAWAFSNGFLRLILHLKDSMTSSNIFSIIGFTDEIEKKFILKYKGTQEIEDEEDKQNQLYLLYILHKKILKEWNWRDNFNFGAYKTDDYPDQFCIFHTGSIFQKFDRQWRYNVGYVSNDGIWVQDNYDKTRNYLKELWDWAH
jgi:hypothetical protein